MQRYRIDVELSRVADDPSIVTVATLTPDPAGDLVHIDDALRLAASLREALDFAPPTTWLTDFERRERYEAAQASGYAILKELGQ